MTAAPDPTVYPLDHLALRGLPDAPALVFKTHTLSYEALNRRLGQLAAWLVRAVPEPGARVATWLPKSELACLMPLAAVRAGLVHVPVNPLLKRAQVAHILADQRGAACDAGGGRSRRCGGAGGRRGVGGGGSLCAAGAFRRRGG